MNFLKPFLFLLLMQFSFGSYSQIDSIECTFYFKDLANNQYLENVSFELYSNKGLLYKNFTSDSLKLQLKKNLKYSCIVTKDGYSYEKLLFYPDTILTNKIELIINLQPIASHSKRMLPVLFFRKNVSEFSDGPEIDAKIEYIKETMNSNPNLKIIIIAFSDEDENNGRRLRKKRSKFVYNKLVSIGLDKKRISMKYVKNEPFLVLDETDLFKKNTLLNREYIATLENNLKDKAHEFNCRVEFLVER